MGSIDPQGRADVNRALACWIGAVLASPQAHGAAAADPPAGANPLESVVVTATRGPRALEDVAGTVTVKKAADIEAELSRDIKDLIRYEPGISVANSAGRFGLSGFNVRGIDGDRVLIEVDGVPVADSFSIGSFASAGRDFVDVASLKRVEIFRGAASSLYGSDAIGGVVAFVTKDPADYFAGDGGSVHADARGAWYDADDSYAATATAAWRGEALSAMLQLTHRDGQELANQGDVFSADSTRTAPDPQDYDSDNVLAKLVWDLAQGQRIRITAETTRDDTFTDAISGRRTQALGPATVRTLDLTGDDSRERDRLAFDHSFSTGAAIAEEGSWQVYWQDSETIQRTEELRLTTGFGPPFETLRQRRASFEQEVLGGELTLRKQFGSARAAQTLTYGLEFARTDSEQLRDGSQTDLGTGEVTNVVQPDTFPVRDFPLTETIEAAAFVQDEIVLGRWTLIPGLRADYYNLNPKSDAIFEEDNPLSPVVGIDHTSVSPKLGIVRQLGESMSAFLQYAEGFRAPPYDDVNIGFTNLAFGYTAIPNPDLRPEESRGFEVGLRGGEGGNYYSIAAFHNDYEDFIESLVVTGVDPESGLLVFQSQNIAEARIYGLEFRGGLDFGSFSESLAGWRMRASVAYARGDDETADLPLNSVDPLKGVLGVGYTAGSGRWGTELVLTAVDRKDRIDESAGPQFAAPGYDVLDLLAHVALGERTTLRFGIGNLTDETYWEWSDVRGRPSGDPVIDRYSRPGRSLSASIDIQF
jgi:hemoglobin/transferrin/lactoferrin receptor protein